MTNSGVDRELRALQAQGWHTSRVASQKLHKLVERRSEAAEQQDFGEFVRVSVKILQLARTDFTGQQRREQPSENGRGDPGS